MRRVLAATCLLLSACMPAERPWELPWPRAPLSRIESVSALPDGRYPIDLPTVLRLAGANNLDIAYIREKVYEAHAREVLAQERFWPTIGAEVTYRRHEGLTQGTDGTFVDVDKQQVFTGGRLRLSWQVGDALYASFAASQRYDAASESLRAAENFVALQAAVSYYELLREQLKLGVLTESVRISRQLESEFSVAVEAGRGFRGDVLRASVQAAGSQIALERANEALRLASIRLGSLLRLAPGIELFAAEQEPRALDLVSVDATEGDLVDQALAARPELREAMAELGATEQERAGATWGPFMPDVQADAGIGGLGEVPSDVESSRDYVVTLGWKIGPGGFFDVGKQRLTDARVRQAEIQLQRVRLRVVDEVRSARAQLQSRSKLLEITRRGVRDAGEALKLNQERQAGNIGLPLEVLQAEEALTRARLDHYAAVLDYNQAQVRLTVALGRKLE